jgi:hypothetical protein
MSRHACRSGRKERIRLIEHLLALGLLEKLHHRALGAKTHFQFKEILSFKLIWSKEAIGNRHLTK